MYGLTRLVARTFPTLTRNPTRLLPRTVSTLTEDEDNRWVGPYLKEDPVDPAKFVESFNKFIRAEVKRDDYGMTLELFRKLPSKLGIVLDESSYEIAIKGLCERGTIEALDKVRSLLDEMVNKEMKVWTSYDLVLDELFHNGSFKDLYANGTFPDGKKVWEWIEDRPKVSELINGRTADTTAAAAAARLNWWVNEGRFLEAEKFVELKLKTKELEGKSAYNILFEGYCKHGKLDEAKRVYRDFLTGDCDVGLNTYLEVVPILCEKGELDFALELTNRCVRSGYGYKECSGLVDIVAKLLVKESRDDEAKELAKIAELEEHH